MFQLGSCANLMSQPLGPGMKSHKKQGHWDQGLESRKEGEAAPEKGRTPMWASELPAKSLVPEKVMETHSSILAGKVPWTEEPDGLQYKGSQRVGHR